MPISRHARRSRKRRASPAGALLTLIDRITEAAASAAMALLRACAALARLAVTALLRAVAGLLRITVSPFALLARAVGRRNNAAWRCRKLSGEEFEEYVALLLGDAGFRDIELTRASGDQGVDVLCSRAGKRYAVQCKNYQGTVGNAAVQEAFAGAQFYGCDVAAVVCPGAFTRAARELAASTGVRLWDGAWLTRMMKKSGRRP